MRIDHRKNDDSLGCTVFLNEKQTVWQGWEIMIRYSYTAIPVLDADQRYHRLCQ